ncbi:MAG: ATP synthase F0 subunit B [Myxococcales bacterium]|nr:ATP synthase F0 subunit B [Myxococcales bacterium]
MIDLDKTIVVQLAIFLVALVVLRALIFKPMVQLIEAREESIDGARAEAKAMEADAKNQGATFDEEMRKLRLSAADERDRLREEGKRLEGRILVDVRSETQQELSRAEARIADEGDRIRRELRDKVPLVGREIATKILRREV